MDELALWQLGFLIADTIALIVLIIVAICLYGIRAWKRNHPKRWEYDPLIDDYVKKGKKK